MNRERERVENKDLNIFFFFETYSDKNPTRSDVVVSNPAWLTWKTKRSWRGRVSWYADDLGRRREGMKYIDRSIWLTCDEGEEEKWESFKADWIHLKIRMCEVFLKSTSFE